MQPGKAPVHISSLIVHCLPKNFNTILDEVSQYACCEIGAHNGNDKIVSILETENESQIMDTIHIIQLLPGVISATMVYHEIDEEAAEQ